LNVSPVGDEMKMKRIRAIRFWLPLSMVVVSLVLTRSGEHKRQTSIEEVVRHYGGLFEPVSDTVATYRYLDFAINAPAWVAAVNTPPILRVSPISNPALHDRIYGRIMRRPWHWYYYGYLLGMWYFVGAMLENAGRRRQRVWRLRTVLIAMFFVFYGLLCCWTASKFGQYEYLPWFEKAVYSWGIVLTSVGAVWMTKLLLERSRTGHPVLP
jgi:hypothetical protein